MRRTALLIATLALAGCGRRETLQPLAGHPMPPKAAQATTAPTVDKLLTSSAEARPDRSDEPLRRSEERPDDRFDLPPPG